MFIHIESDSIATGLLEYDMEWESIKSVLE